MRVKLVKMDVLTKEVAATALRLHAVSFPWVSLKRVEMNLDEYYSDILDRTKMATFE